MSPRPPTERTMLGEAFQAHQHAGALRLQRCVDCGAWQYPAREVCRVCLSDEMSWEDPGLGVVSSFTRLHMTNEPCFQMSLPFHIGSVRVGDVQLIAFLADGAARLGAEVTLAVLKDAGDRFVVCAVPKGAHVDPTARPSDVLRMR